MSIDGEPVSFRPNTEVPVSGVDGWTNQTLTTPNPLWENEALSLEVAKILDSSTHFLEDQYGLTRKSLMPELYGSPELRILRHEGENRGILWQIRVPQVDAYIWQGTVISSDDLEELSDVLFIMNQDTIWAGVNSFISAEEWENSEVGYPDPGVSEVVGEEVREIMLSPQEVEAFRAVEAPNVASTDYEITDRDYDKMLREAETGQVNGYVDDQGNLRVIVWNTVTQMGQIPRVMYLHPDHIEQRTHLTGYLMLAMHNREA
jgi:hypothetical protein